MRRSGHTNAAIGYGPGDHVCWVFEGPAAWLDVVVPYLREGAECRDRLVYVGDKAEGALIEDLAGLPGRDALLASGQLQVMPLALAYQGHTTGFDVGRQVATFHEQALAAVADGYRSLRLATDVSTLAETEQAARGFTAYELLVDAMASCTPWTSLCGYDRDRVGPDAARALCFVHPAHHGEVPLRSSTPHREVCPPPTEAWPPGHPTPDSPAPTPSDSRRRRHRRCTGPDVGVAVGPMSRPGPRRKMTRAPRPGWRPGTRPGVRDAPWSGHDQGHRRHVDVAGRLHRRP